MGRISFFLKEAFGSLRRNYFMTIAALVTVFLSILVLGAVLVFVYTTDALLAEVESKVEITVYLTTDPDPTQDEIATMQSEIMSWNEVKSSTYVSKKTRSSDSRKTMRTIPRSSRV
jgi:cell division transport system permease protein